MRLSCFYFFFFQAEDGIRDLTVTGVQTCALPIFAEVEMTCTHVVVMHAGRVVTQGPVAELVDSEDTTIVDLPEHVDHDVIRAGVHALEATDGITEVRVDTPTRVVVVADRGRAEVVAAAVTAGLP